MAKKKKTSRPRAAKTVKAKKAAPRVESTRDRATTTLLGMVKDLGGRFEELKRRTSEGADRAREIAQEIRKNVIEPRWRALKNARRKKR